MAKNQSTYTLKIDAELGNLQQILNQAKKSLSGFMASGNAPKGLEQAFVKINTLLGQISDKAGKPLDLKGLTAAGKDLTSVQDSFRSIIRLLGEFDDLSNDIKFSFLSDEEQRKIQKASKALLEYGKITEEIAKKQKSLETSKKSNVKDKSVLDRATKKVSGLTDEKTVKQAKLSGAKTKLNAAKTLENGNPKDIAKYEAEVSKLTAELEVLEKNLKEANQELAQAQTTYNTSAQDIKKMEAEIKKASGASLKQLKEEAKNLGISLEGLNGHDAAKQIEILTGRLEEFKKQAINGSRPAFNAIKEGCQNAGKAADELQDELKQAVEATKEMDEAAAQRDAFEAKIKQFLGLSGAAQVLRSALRDALQTITELDATMTEMAVVTDLTVGDYWNQLPEYSKQASDLGVSINSAYKAATLYYQQGLKGNEVTKISAETLKMAKIAGLDAADATDKMTAALRGFNMELNEMSAQRVSDVYSELAAITAADVDEISSAMTKTASIAHSAGMEFETTAAFLSQIIETTRESAETAGTALKTVIARFQELKKDPAEIGEVDGEIVDANKIETALRSVGVALRDSSGQFRELDDVFLELSSKWDGLDKNTQRYIATIAAGSRQQSRFIAMMSDYGRTQELVASANNSAGASQKQFEKTTESLEYKVERLKNAWHEFTMGIMDSDLLKFGVDILSKFLEIVNKATNALDGVGGSLVKIVSVLGVFKLGQKIFNKIKVPLINFFADVVKLSREKGEESGKAFDAGVRASVESSNKKEESNSENKDGLENYDTRSFGQKIWSGIKNKTRVAEIGSGWSAIYGEGSKKEGGLRDSQIQLAKLKQEGGDRKARLQKLKTAQTDEDINQAKKELLEYDEVQKKVFEESQKGWNQVANGLTKMGETAMAAGVGISMLGGLLQSMGLEEVGEGVSEFGNIITLAGTAIVTIIPIIKTLSSTLVAGGVSAQAAWWWAILIVAAVAALVVGIVAIAKAVKNSTPEAKLKKAEEAAEKASEAADQATESYENLKDSLSGLGEQYKTLEKLTQGTKEWNEAILEINNSVLDLIEKYPELAQYVKSQDGYLSLDINSDEVQKVIKSAQASALLSKNASALANSKVSFAESQVVKKNYNLNGDRIDELSRQIASGEIIIKDGSFVSGTKTIESLGYTTEQLEKLYKQNSDNIAALREYGNSLLSAEAQQKTGFSSMILSAQQMANTEGFTNKILSISSNIVQESSASQIYEKELSKISSINYIDDKSLTDYQRQERDAAVKQVYGQDAKIEDLTNEQIQSAIAQTKAVTDVVNSINNIPIMLSTFAEQNTTETTKMLNNLLQDWEGGEMSMSDYNHLAKMSTEELKKIYKDLGVNAKKIFGSEEAFLKKIDDTKKILNSQNKSMKTSVEAVFGQGAKIPNWNIPPEIGSQLLLKFQEVFNKADSSTFKTFYDQFDTILSKLTEEEQRIFSSIFESMDWSNTADLATLPDKLNQAGINLQEFGVDLYDFIDNVAEASHAIAKLSAEELSKVLGNVSELVNNINKGEQDRVVSEEQYKNLLYADPTLQKEFAKVSGGYMYLGNSMNDLAQAVIENTKTLKGEDADTAKKALTVFDAVEAVANEQATKMSNYNTYASYDAQIADYNAQIAAKEERINAIGDPDPDSFGTWFQEFIWGFSASQGIVDAESSPRNVAKQLLEEKQKLETEKAVLIEQKNQAEQNKNSMAGYAQYGTYQAVSAETISNLSRQQLIDFLASLDAKSDLSSLDISGLTDNYDFNQMTDEVLKNMVAQIFQAMGNRSYYEGLASKDPDVDIGNDIIRATLGGATSLSNWYATEYASHKEGGTVLKGAMRWLASNYGLSEEVQSQYFHENGEAITEKFDEFIALISKKEFEEKMAIPKEQTIDLINQVKDALIEARQKEIDDLASSFEAIADANNKIVDAIQDWVAEDRQRRKNEEAEQNIADKRSQLAYLGMDTSGNSLEILNFEEEIRQAEQDYQDDLIDQSIQKLQDANEIAQTQRDNQISLLQSQLDFWKESDQIWGEVNTIIVNSQSAIANGGEISNTELGQLLNSFSGNLSPEERNDFVNNLIELLGGYTKYNAYATGGLADFTGPAWLDGTKSRPEYVLNADQTERFFSLVDVLEGYDRDKKPEKSGDNYFEIEINVEKLENDYDVEQVANKIRKMIYEDAMYRNVNAINNMR